MLPYLTNKIAIYWEEKNTGKLMELSPSWWTTFFFAPPYIHQPHSVLVGDLREFHPKHMTVALPQGYKRVCKCGKILLLLKQPRVFATGANDRKHSWSLSGDQNSVYNTGARGGGSTE